MKIYFIYLLIIIKMKYLRGRNEDPSVIEMFDLTRPTLWKDLRNYYDAIKNHWKICINCGIPGMGTSLHLDHDATSSSTRPAVIPTEYLITRLAIIDASHLAKRHEGFVMSLEVALQWVVLKRDPKEPTLVMFKFDWEDTNDYKQKCVCDIPGLSYELAEWIAKNLTHVVGIATDAPTLESKETRERITQTISSVLGKSGVYMIENVNIKKRIPTRGCMTIAMPLMLLEASYVPTRLVAICPSFKTDHHVTIALKKVDNTVIMKSRNNDINLHEIMNL